MSKEDEFIQKHLALIKEKTKMIKEETGEYFPYGKEWQKEMMKFPKPALIMMLAGEFQKVKQYEKEAQQFKQSSPIGVAEQIAADEIMHLFELSLYEESGYIVTKGKIIEILKGIAGSQWASPRPSWVRLKDLPDELPDVVLVLFHGRKMFAYNTQYNLNGLQEVIKHHQNVPCLPIMLPKDRDDERSVATEDAQSGEAGKQTPAHPTAVNGVWNDSHMEILWKLLYNAEFEDFNEALEYMKRIYKAAAPKARIVS